MFEKEKSKVEDLTDEIKEYLNTRADLAVLKISDKLSDIVSTVISGIVMAVVFFFFLLFSSFALSIWLGNILENNYLGFLFVAVIYLIVGVIVYFIKDKMIKKPIANMIIEKSLKNQGDEN